MPYATESSRGQVHQPQNGVGYTDMSIKAAEIYQNIETICPNN
jgi:hypothetical protein